MTKSYTERTCPGCGAKWSALRWDPTQYCSRECLFTSGHWHHPIDRDCLNCGKPFKAKWKNDRDGYRKYCSRECALKDVPPDVEKICGHCGETFYVRPGRADDIYCSALCKNAHMIRDLAPTWKGGEVSQNDRPFRRIDREGYAAKYEGEHRLIAAREIGRPIVRGECIICLDRNNENLDPSNLFLCPSIKEMRFIIQGNVPWPEKSNLADYRKNGYVRPEVAVVVHEWEHGRRRVHDRGKWITRHPQADEIIKRRRAGASLKELARAFGCGQSAMLQTLKKRL